MAIRDIIPIDVYDLPNQFDYEIDDITYLIKIDYNEQGDFFTAGIGLSEDEWIVQSWKMMLNQPLFFNIDNDNLPDIPLTPMDESGLEDRISITNFGDTVFLFEDAVNEKIDPADFFPIDSDNQGDD